MTELHNVHLIGIHGPLQSGKTTMANKLKELIEASPNAGSCVILPYAAPLKAFATLLGWDGEKDDKGRRLLQLIGTDCGRECIDQNIWVDKWNEEVEHLHTYETHPLFVIADDMRFDNEWMTVSSSDGTTVKVKGRGSPGEHASEHEMSDEMFDFVVDNSGSIEEYHEKIETLLMLNVFNNIKAGVTTL